MLDHRQHPDIRYRPTTMADRPDEKDTPNSRLASSDRGNNVEQEREGKRDTRPTREEDNG